MNRRSSRRGLLSLLGGLCTLTLGSGCLSGAGQPGGSLYVDNRSSTDYTLTLTVEKISDETDADKGPAIVPTPEGPPMSERMVELSVSAYSETHRSQFLEEPGTFFVQVRTESGQTGRSWIGLYRTTDGGVGGEYVEITFYEDDGNMTVFGQESSA